MTVQCLLDVGEVMCFQFDSKVYMTESVASHRSYHNQSSYTYHLLQTPIAHTFKHQHFIKQNRVDFRLQHHNSPTQPPRQSTQILCHIYVLYNWQASLLLLLSTDGCNTSMVRVYRVPDKDRKSCWRYSNYIRKSNLILLQL